jgi:hypothetical protein
MRFKKLIVATLAVCSAICMAPQTLYAQQTMNNDAVIKLVKAGLSDDLIVSTINSQPGTYDTSTDGLIALKKSGVSDKVVGAIVTKKLLATVPTSTQVSVSAPVASNFDDPTQVHAPGIYILAAGLNDKQVHLTKLEHVEPNQEKANGMLSSVSTFGIMKMHVLVVLNGSKATTLTSDPKPVFYAYIPEDDTSFGGNSISVKDFSLIKFDVKGKRREADVASVGITGASVGAEKKSLQSFTSELVKPGIYKLTLAKPLATGEYAFQQMSNTALQINQNTGNNFAAFYFDFGIVANQ